jgi:outer membrane protein TolC
MKLTNPYIMLNLRHLGTFIFSVLVTLQLNGQKAITLKECYESALAKTALSEEKQAYSGISELKESNISKGWLPTLDLNGSALYNSSVIDLSPVFGSLPIPGLAGAIKPLPHDQYKLTVDVNQVIYDGGAIKSSRELERAELKINEKQTDADLYKIRSQINSLYFNLLLIDRQKLLLNSYLDLLNNRIKSLQSAVQNGVRLKSDVDILTAERIKVEQQITENGIRRDAMIKVLSDITGISMANTTEFILPSPDVATVADEINRPEIELFDLRQHQLDAGLSLTESRRMPKAFGFASFGYGNPPGNNFFKDQFDTYYIIGAGIKWNIFDWNRTKNEKQVITLQKGIIESRKADLNDNLRRQLESKKADIESLEKMISSDNELVSLRKNITAASESQYQNGTITSNEYLDALNSEKQSQINAEIHKISLAMAKVEYLNISGKDPE